MSQAIFFVEVAAYIQCYIENMCLLVIFGPLMRNAGGGPNCSKRYDD